MSKRRGAYPNWAAYLLIPGTLVVVFALVFLIGMILKVFGL